MRRANKFWLRPTARQHVALKQCLASHRELYNAALQERRDAWRLSGTAVSYGDQSAQLKQIRKARPGCGGVVVLVPAGDVAPSEPGLRRVLPAGEGR